MTKQKIIIVGAGGHARVIFDLLNQQKIDIHAIIDPSRDIDYLSKNFPNSKYFKHDDEILNDDPSEIMLINGLGSIPNDGSKRKKVFYKFSEKGFKFLSIVSEQAIISPSVKLSEGAQVMSGAIIQSGVFIGLNSIVNTGAVVDHDCIIGDHTHIAPGAVLSGKVTTGESVHIGTNASVIQSVKLGSFVVVGAGSSVTRNLEDGSTIYPAKTFLKNG